MFSIGSISSDCGSKDHSAYLENIHLPNGTIPPPNETLNRAISRSKRQYNLLKEDNLSEKDSLNSNIPYNKEICPNLNSIYENTLSGGTYSPTSASSASSASSARNDRIYSPTTSEFKLKEDIENLKCRLMDINIFFDNYKCKVRSEDGIDISRQQHSDACKEADIIETELKKLERKLKKIENNATKPSFMNRMLMYIVPEHLKPPKSPPKGDIF